MDLHTKYDIGQKVWYIDKKLETVPCNICDNGYVEIKGHTFLCPNCGGYKTTTDDSGPHKPCNANIEVITISDTGFEYDCDRMFGFAEDDLYPTKKDAQAECDRRNNQ